MFLSTSSILNVSQTADSRLVFWYNASFAHAVDFECLILSFVKKTVLTVSFSDVYDLVHTGSLQPVNGYYSTVWQRIRMACCSERLSGALSMEAYLSDCKTTRNPPEF